MAEPSGHRSRGSDDLGVYDDAKSYYTEERHQNRAGPRTRTYSQVSSDKLDSIMM
jgi:alpha,alpha-trehalase